MSKRDLQANREPKKDMPAKDRHPTDVGNARRLVDRHGQDLRFVHPGKQWFVWDGRRWAADLTGEVVRRVKETQEHFYKETLAEMEDLASLDDEEEIKQGRAELRKRLDHALKWEDARRIQACLEMTKSEPGIPLLPEQLDTDTFLLNVINGTLDLRTGELRQHRREDHCTKMAPVAYDPVATCPLWNQCLQTWMGGAADMIEYLQQVIGYCLTGSVREQCMWFLYGAGSNGKSTFLKTLLALLGDYGIQAVSDLLIVKTHESHPTERADLAGVRLAATIEVDEGRRMAEVLMKQLTGGDNIRARRMRKDFFEFPPTHKIFLAANHKPVIQGTDHAVWRRIKLVPFTVKIDDDHKDPDLDQKLKAELPGILAWAVEGCRAWQRQRTLREPDGVQQATAEYHVEQDHLAGFLRTCVRQPEAKVQSSKLYEAYQEWSGDKYTSQMIFSRRLDEKGYLSQKSTGGRMFFKGIGLPDGEHSGWFSVYFTHAHARSAFTDAPPLASTRGHKSAS